MGRKKGKKDHGNPLLEDPLDVAEREEQLLDDAAKSMVIKNPLLGTGDVWTEKKLQGLVSAARCLPVPRNRPELQGVSAAVDIMLNIATAVLRRMRLLQWKLERPHPPMMAMRLWRSVAPHPSSPAPAPPSQSHLRLPPRLSRMVHRI